MLGLITQLSTTSSSFPGSSIILPFLKFLESSLTNLYILIGIFAFLVIAKNMATKKIKIQIIPKLIDLLTALVLVLVLIVSYHRFAPAIANFLKTNNSTNTTSTTKKPTTKTNAKSTSGQQTTPSYQAPKQLYYSVSCSSCWSEGCSHNGYSYGGYDSYYYSYYRNICKACSCNDYKSFSFWK